MPPSSPSSSPAFPHSTPRSCSLLGRLGCALLAFSPTLLDATLGAGLNLSGLPAFVGQPVSEEASPFAFVSGSPDDFPLVATWYRADVGTSWSGQGTIPAALSVVKTETVALPEIGEGEELGEVLRLTGVVFTEPGELWLHLQPPSGAALVLQTEDPFPEAAVGEAPTFSRWMGVKPQYAVGHTFRGDNSDPFLIVNTGGLPTTATFYAGATGETTNPLGTESGNRTGPFPGTAMIPFPALTLNESLSLWARVTNGVGSTDTAALVLSVFIPTEPVEFRQWYETISWVNSGANLDLRARLNAESSAFTFRWYWGESGDTSFPFGLPFNLVGSPSIQVTVPATPRSFWVRATSGTLVVDSPTAQLVPMTASAPEILDQPDDVLFSGNPTPGHGVSLVATGGDLTFNWFWGESGDQSTPASTLRRPGGNGRAETFILALSPEQDAAWCLVSNSLGSVATRTVRGRTPSINELVITHQHTTHRLTAGDVLRKNAGYQSPHVFPFEPTVPLTKVELYQQAGEDWLLIDDNAPNQTSELLSTAPTRWLRHSLSDHTFAYPSGTYRHRYYVGEDFVESDDLTLINEAQDPTAAHFHSQFSLLRMSTASTEGGLIEVVVSLPSDYLPATLQLLSVVDGEWESLDLDQSPSFVYNANRSTDWDFYRHSQLRLRWPSNESPHYWLTVEREDGPTAVLRIPGTVGGAATEHAASAPPVEIVLPIGIETIPLPKLPALAEWFLGDANTAGPPVTLPLGLGSIPRNGVPLVAVNEAGEALSTRFLIRIDGDAPPLLEEAPAQLVTTTDGHILWAGRVQGEVAATELFALDGEVTTSVGRWQGNWTAGLRVPPGVERVRLEWSNDASTRSWEGPVVRLPETFVNAVGASRVDHDMAFSDTLGSFLYLRSYPWVLHGEFGWTFLSPAPDGVYFFGLMPDNGGGWYWTSPAVFPFLYSYRTNSWEYYLRGSYGWIYAYTSGTWRKAAL